MKNLGGVSNDKDVATKEYVDTAVGNIVNALSSYLDEVNGEVI